MNVARELIDVALFNRLSASSSFETASRQLRHWSDVPAEQQPAIFLHQLDEESINQRSVPQKVTLQYEVYLYLNTMSQQLAPDIVPATLLNNYLDDIDTAMLPDDQANNVLTLGGLVSHCWISGKTEKFEGLLGDQAVAIFPVSILVPA